MIITNEYNKVKTIITLQESEQVVSRTNVKSKKAKTTINMQIVTLVKIMHMNTIITVEKEEVVNL